MSDPSGILLLVRHGAVEASKEKRFIGQMDVALSPEGFAQAQRLSRYLENFDPVQVWSSDLSRAVQTAAVVCRERRVELQTDFSLREIHLGKWEGADMAEIRRRYPEAWETRGREMDRFRPPEAESFADLQRRIVPCIHRIAGSVSGNVLIVTHAGVIRVFLCHILEMPLRFLFRFHLDHCGVTLVQGIRGMPCILAINRSPCASFVPPSN